MKKPVLFVLPYPLGKAPSQRFRVEAYFAELEKAGIEYKVNCFLSKEGWDILYNKGHLSRKLVEVIKGFIRRIILLFKLGNHEFVFIHREATPLGPPFFEWVAARVLKKKIIYDFDDAIWMKNTVTPNPLVDWIKAFWKVRYIIKWADKISGGNNYLCNYAKRFNRKVILLPTVVDTEHRYNFLKQHCNSRKPIIGWTGSHTTMNYLEMVFPVLKELEQKYDFEFLVISNKEPQYLLKSLRFLKWNEKSEIEDLARIDIGLMPMFDDQFSEGKCGFKIIQYLALGIPAVASPVGVNAGIVENQKNGFLCREEREWAQAIEILLNDTELRRKFGSAGRIKIQDQFSISANVKKFLTLFS